jgi:hypothetical protein
VSEKPLLEESEQPPICPHCNVPLRKLDWHRVRGGPMSISYLVLISCGSCRALLGSAAT